MKRFVDLSRPCKSSLVTLLLVGSAFTACNSNSNPPADAEKVVETEVVEELLPNGEPTRITVQHCLISFAGAIPDKPIRRTKEDAAALADQLMKLLESGDSFDDIVRQFTDDSAPGIYSMSNTGVASNAFSGEMPREQMVSAFGDVGFKLKVGEYGLAPYDIDKSKYGWHIIKRIK